MASRARSIKLYSTTDEARIMELQLQGYEAKRAGAHYWTIQNTTANLFTGHSTLAHTEAGAWQNLITSLLADDSD